MVPDFLIVGAARSGTTSLYKYLIQHPCILPAIRKEVHYFDYNYFKGLTWYRAHFPTNRYSKNLANQIKKRVITGEGAPYYMFHPLAPKRAAQMFPDLKLMFLLRDPIARAHSSYNKQCQIGKESLSFSAAIKSEEERIRGEHDKLCKDEGYSSANHKYFSYANRGIYINQLENWLQYFSREQMLIINSEDFYANPSQIYEKCLSFLGIPHYELKSYQQYNSSSYEQKIDSETFSYLSNLFKPYNKKLFEFLGEDFGWK